MARQVIVLDTVNDPNGNQNIRCLFWLAPGANKQLPNPNAVSTYRGATAAELSAIQAGLIVEQTVSIQYPNGTVAATIQADLQTRWAAANTAFQSQPNLNQFFGASWDGTSWTAAPATPPPIQLQRYQIGGVQVATLGDNTVIAGTAGQSIVVMRMKMIATGAVTATIKDGAGTALLGPFPMVTGVQVDFPWANNSEPWFVCSAGNAFVINLSAAVVVSVRGSFSKG